MDELFCLFKHAREECRSKKHSYIRYLICEKHLRDIYGLEITWKYIETATEMIYVGFNLSVAPNTYFKENDVIIPVRRFFDVIYRKEFSSGTNQAIQEADKKFRMNPHLHEYIVRKMKNGHLELHDRYTYEMIRNLSELTAAVNSHPVSGCDNDPNHTAYLRSKMTISETYIKENVLATTYKTISYYTHTAAVPTITEKKVTEMETVSLLFHFLLSKAEFGVHTLNSIEGNTKEINRLVPNAIFVEDVGLVAMRQISNPSTIVVFGQVTGFDSAVNSYETVYDENIIVEPKEIVQPHSQQPHNLMSNQVMTRKALRTSCISNRR